MRQPSARPSIDGERGPGAEGYVSSLAPQPHPLTPPGPQPARWKTLKASLAWIVGSWLRPADAEAGWEQRAGREDRTP